MERIPVVLNLIVALVAFVSLDATAQSAFDKMSNSKMEKILHREAQDVQRMPGSEEVPGRWQVIYMERTLYIITDELANRMRVMTPVIEEGHLEMEDYKLVMEANFDRALDAKYSLYQGYLWSSFTHPLQELTVEQFKDAMRQVATLADRYGSSYSSTDMVFGGDQDN